MLIRFVIHEDAYWEKFSFDQQSHISFTLIETKPFYVFDSFCFLEILLP